MVGATVIGVGATQRFMTDEKERWIEAHKAALLKMGVTMIRDSQGNVPTDTGALRKAAYVRVVVSRKGLISVKAGYRARHAGAISIGQIKKKSGKIVKFKLRNGTTRYFAKAVRAREAGYAAQIAHMTKQMYTAKMLLKDVYNPYPWRRAKPGKWSGFRREIRKQIAAEHKAKWGGFNSAIRKQIKAQAR